MKKKAQAIFITATDTHVGKTVATLVLGLLYRNQGLDVGVMKPVQCGGTDAAFLRKSLNTGDDLGSINPCYAAEPLSPHLAFRRAGTRISISRIRKAYEELKARHDILLVEGAGGIMVPLKNKYYTADLIRDLNAPVIIVARLGLGTINHTLLTVNQVKAYGLTIKGILFSDTNPRRKTVAEQTNPAEIGRLSGCRILGTIPYLTDTKASTILKQCRHLHID